MRNLDHITAPKARLSRGLLATTSLMGVLAAFPAAYGQSSNVETITVTGTAIKGVAPVGTNLITVDRSFIETSGAGNTEQILSMVPQLSITFGVAGQGGDTNNEGAQSGPSIHGIGSQNAASTLILMDGHRLPAAGQSTSVVDPSIIPSAALQRVEILPDGASSIYGADAVSGVMNFITRKDFTGWETQAQRGQASDYNATSISQTFGKAWQGGNVLVSYQYSSNSHLLQSDRSYMTARQDILRGADITAADYPGLAASPPAGSLTTTPDVGHGTTGPFNVAIPYASDGVNKDDFNCPIATIAANSTAAAFIYPYNGAGLSVTQTTPSQGVCSRNQYNQLLPSETRNSVLINVNQEVTSSITAYATVIYAGTSVSKPGYNTNKGGTNHGTVTATVFGPTGSGAALGIAQRNPFYVGNATTGTSSELIRHDFNELLASNGIAPVTHDGNLDLVGIAGVDWDMGGGWDTTFDFDAGYTEAPENDYGALCTPCANLALNGTLNANGTASNTVATSAGGNVGGLGLGSDYNVTQALTTANALDVWDPAGSTNKTSKAVLTSLVDSTVVTDAHTTLTDFTLKTSGPLFDPFGAGPIKVAVGGEYEKELLWRYSTSAGLGGTTNFARLNVRGVNRLAQSAFLELNIPLITHSDMPLLHELSADISGRYDHFSDFGDTKNPKIGLDWVPFDGIRAHASFGTSFVEPAIDVVVAPGTPGSVATSTTAIGSNIILFNSTTAYSKNPNADEGSGIAGTWVATAASCAAAGSNPVDAAGNTVAATSASAVGCKLNLTNSPQVSAPLLGPIGPETGMSYSAGTDIDAGKLIPALEGLVASVTYYNIKFVGYITGGGVTTFQPQVISFAPPGGWDINGTVIQQVLAGNSGGSSLPSTIYVVSRGGVQNAFNLWQQGLDFSISYRLNTDNLGTFNFSESGNQILGAQQGSNNVPRVSTVDGRGNGRQTNIELTSVTSVNWHLDAYSAQLQFSYAHPFSLANTNFPYNLAGPAGQGYQHVGAQYNVNLHTAYNLPNDWVSGMQVFANIQNLLDTPLPFSNAGSVSNGQPVGNPIGREFILGFRLAR